MVVHSGPAAQLRMAAAGLGFKGMHAKRSEDLMEPVHACSVRCGLELRGDLRKCGLHMKLWLLPAVCVCPPGWQRAVCWQQSVVRWHWQLRQCSTLGVAWV
jgi:hypothetical protein